jgi:manganese/zinc/iron transport system permease protein
MFNAENATVSLLNLFSADHCWILIMGYLVGATCGLLGNYLIFRRMTFLADAVSHSVLPGIVIAFLITQTRSNTALFIGSLVAALTTFLLIHLIQLQTRIKSETAIGIVFSTLFSIGIILIALFTDKVDLDQDCVLYGEIAFIGYEPQITFFNTLSVPIPVLRMVFALLSSLAFVSFFYKELLIISFDPALASLLCSGSKPIYYGLMLLIALAIVCSFEAVGAILVVGMMVLPGATAGLISHRLFKVLMISLLLPAFYSLFGLYLAYRYNSSISSCIVVVALVIFLIIWLLKCCSQFIENYRSLRCAAYF